MDIMAANLQQQRAIVEQLRREAGISRLPVSEACSVMMKYISEHENDDCLLNGFSSQKVNPFREKSTCQIL
ncbi:guanine nucleotide-binding protein subunit gamma-1-like [Condylostylus longicornis]|uniref:guanine nucleotide-binding protein subunit gamma-1-like n=1 Tax=Condylostylus longicornis TaxID=2530218 RepID=UPI00244E1B82|nr:guanine nucleotide-binding protein subunit gamma-1-like [Condylostylus longicornis]